nr:MAG TPA: 54S ribosomal protein [Bacteriophage sp.]
MTAPTKKWNYEWKTAPIYPGNNINTSMEIPTKDLERIKK